MAVKGVADPFPIKVTFPVRTVVHREFVLHRWGSPVWEHNMLRSSVALWDPDTPLPLTVGYEKVLMYKGCDLQFSNAYAPQIIDHMVGKFPDIDVRTQGQRHEHRMTFHAQHEELFSLAAWLRLLGLTRPEGDWPPR